jgi:hypothetical protein
MSHTWRPGELPTSEASRSRTSLASDMRAAVSIWVGSKILKTHSLPILLYFNINLVNFFSEGIGKERYHKSRNRREHIKNAVLLS